MMSEHGGSRDGAGRKLGTVNQRTIERMAAKRHFIDRVIGSTDSLFNAQLDKAIGEKFLFVKRTERDSKGKVLRAYHELVESKQTIIEYLDGELKGGDPISDDDNYYYISTKPADNMAIANMLDRAYGKPTEKVELGGVDDGDMSELTDEELNAKIDRYLEQRRSGS